MTMSALVVPIVLLGVALGLQAANHRIELAGRDRKIGDLKSNLRNTARHRDAVLSTVRHELGYVYKASSEQLIHQGTGRTINIDPVS